MVRHVNIDHGIEIWDGLPGSGKSYGAVDFLIKVILRQRRPVYTNLPIRLRVLRRYLKLKSGSDVVARYIQYLTEDHFNRFIERNQLLSDFSDSMRAEGHGFGVINRMFQQAEGTHKIMGQGADWIPSGSVLILDEFHRWSDQRVQRTENPSYLTYATMHRHHLHRILILTQDKMQVSLTWRRNADRIIHCTDKRNLPFMFGLRLPIPAFAYEEWPVEFADSKNPGHLKPINTDIKIPWFDGGVIWRMYDSFTHMGGYRRLRSGLEEVRKQIEGSDYEKPISNNEENEEVIKTKPMVKFFKAVAVLAVLAAILLYFHGENGKRDTKFEALVSRFDRVEGDLQRLIQSKFINKQTEVSSQSVIDSGLPVVTAVGDDYAMASGQIVSIGGVVGQFELLEVQVASGVTLWVHSVSGARFRVPVGGVRTGEQKPGSSRSSSG